MRVSSKDKKQSSKLEAEAASKAMVADTSSVTPCASSSTASSEESDVASQPTSPEKNASSLHVVLLDDGQHWTWTQQEVLAVAKALHECAYSFEILCPENSPLMQHAKAAQLPVWPLRGRLWLLWRYKRAKPLMIHAFSPTMAVFMHKWASWRRKGATVCMHSVYALPDCTLATPSTKEQKSSHAALLQAWKDVQKIIFPCEHMVTAWKKYVEHSFTSLPSACICPALEPEPWLALKESYSASASRCIFMVAAHLRDDSGVDTVLKSMAYLLEQEQKHGMQNSFEVRVVGSGTAFESLLTQARGLGVDGPLALLGEQAFEDVLPAAHGLILPQNTADMACEPLVGQSLVHAFMAACCLQMPIMATNIAPYNAWDKDFLWRFDPEDAQALGEHMWRCVQDASLREKQGKHAHCMQDFVLMPRLQQEYMQVYKAALEQRGWGFLYKKSLV